MGSRQTLGEGENDGKCEKDSPGYTLAQNKDLFYNPSKCETEAQSGAKPESKSPGTFTLFSQLDENDGRSENDFYKALLLMSQSQQSLHTQTQ